MTNPQHHEKRGEADESPVEQALRAMQQKPSSRSLPVAKEPIDVELADELSKALWERSALRHGLFTPMEFQGLCRNVINDFMTGPKYRAHVDRRLKEEREKWEAHKLTATIAFSEQVALAETAEQQLAQTQAELDSTQSILLSEGDKRKTAEARLEGALAELAEERKAHQRTWDDKTEEEATAQSLAKRVVELEAELSGMNEVLSDPQHWLCCAQLAHDKDKQRITELNDALEKERRLRVKTEEAANKYLDLASDTNEHLECLANALADYINAEDWTPELEASALAVYSDFLNRASRQPGEALKDGHAILPVPPEAGTQGARTEGEK